MVCLGTIGHVTKCINIVYVWTRIQSTCRVSGVELVATVLINVHRKRIYGEAPSEFNNFKKSQLQAQQAQQQNQQELAAKFDNLQKEVTAVQKETAQLVANKLKCGPEYQSGHKGNEKHFMFNDLASDNIQTAAGILDKVKLLAAQDATLLKNAKEQLLEGTKAIDGCQ